MCFTVSRISTLTLISIWPGYMWLARVLGVTSSVLVKAGGGMLATSVLHDPVGDLGFGWESPIL